METQTIKSVDELKSGDILVNTNHGFEIEIVEIGKKTHATTNQRNRR